MASLAASVARLTHPRSQTPLGRPSTQAGLSRPAAAIGHDEGRDPDDHSRAAWRWVPVWPLRLLQRLNGATGPSFTAATKISSGFPVLSR
jgi:hypothetical protein